MSDTLSHLAAAALGDMPAIGPRQAAFFAPQPRPPAVSLADAAAALRASPIPPASPSPRLPAGPPLVGDPALIDRPAPSLRRLVRSLARAGDLITPLSTWLPPLAGELDSGPLPASAGRAAGAGAGQATDEPLAPAAGTTPAAGSMSAAETAPAAERTPPTGQPARLTTAADQSSEGEPAPDRQLYRQRRSDETTGSRAPAESIAEPAARASSTAPEAAAIEPLRVESVPAKPGSTATETASVEPEPARQPPTQAAPDATREKAIDAQPGRAGQHLSEPPPPVGPIGAQPRPAEPTPPGSSVSEPAPAGITPAQDQPGDPARPEDPYQPQPAEAHLQPAEPASMEADPLQARSARAESGAEAPLVATSSEGSVNPLPSQPTPVAASRPVQTATERSQSLAGQGQAPVEQGQAPTGQGPALTGQGQILTGQGQVPTGQELRQPPFIAQHPGAGLAPVERAEPNQRPVAGTESGGPSFPAPQPPPALQGKPVLEPELSQALQLEPAPRSKQADQPQSPAGDRLAMNQSTAVRPDVASVIEPAPQSLPEVTDRPAAPAAPPRPTIEITIGRVEVRLRPEAASPARPAPRPKPDLSLDDYLSRQGG